MVAAEERAPETPTPMYASYLTFTTLLDWLKDMDVIPTQIDRSLWGPKFSGSTGAQLFAGCRFLGLMDGDTPRDTLKDLAKADKEERKRLLTEVMRAAYGPATIDGLQGMTPKMLSEAIKALGATDSTLNKAVSFFINAAKAADIPVPGAIAKRARNRPAARGTARRSTKPASGASMANTTPGGQTTKTDHGNSGGASEIDAMRVRYIDMLMKKAEAGDMGDELLDRIESLLGFAEREPTTT